MNPVRTLCFEPGIFGTTGERSNHSATVTKGFKRSHLLTYNDSLGEPFAHSVKTLLTLNRYY